MKKKLIATLVAGAVLSTGIIGLTACGGGGLSINKGAEVDEAGWKAAYTATLDAKNFTVDSYSENTIKMKGSDADLGIENVDITVKSTAEGKAQYDIENVNSYTKATTKVNVSGVPDALKEMYKDQEYVVEVYSVKDGDTVYNAQYYGYNENPEWSVAGYPAEYGSVGNPLLSYLGMSLATEKGGEAKQVSELYSAFEYKSGVYTATLYNSYDGELKVSVSVKDGYVVGFSYEMTETEESDGSSYSETMKVVYNLSNYGSTTVSASDDAKKAVSDYKAENN